MSRNYQHGDSIPVPVIVARLRELAAAVSEGRAAVAREFTMRIPAELDRDADLVLSEAAKRLEQIPALLEIARAARAVSSQRNMDQTLAAESALRAALAKLPKETT